MYETLPLDDLGSVLKMLILEAQGSFAFEILENLEFQSSISYTPAASELGRQLPDIEAPALIPARGSKRSLVDQLLRSRPCV